MKRGLLGNTSGMAIGTTLSRLTGILRDIALVAAVGTAVFSDAYSVANSIPNILYTLIAGGAINSVFIPTLVRRMQDDEDKGQLFANRLLTFIGLILTILVVVTMICAQLIVHVYATGKWSPSDFHVATIFTYWCLPQIFFYGAYTLITQVLNVRGNFVVSMFTPIANNVVVIATALLFVNLSRSIISTNEVSLTALNFLGFGTTLGVALQAAILIPALRKSGFKFALRFDFKGAGLMKVGNLAIWTIGFVFINQISNLVVTRLSTFANTLAEAQGTVAVGLTSFQKGQLMMMLPHAIITVSLITSLLPRLSKTAHSQNDEVFGEQLTASVRLIAALIIPCAGLLLLCGVNVGTLLYGHGVSTAQQGASVGFIASMFAFGLPGFSLFYALIRSYYAREDTRTPFYLNLAFNAVYVGLGYTIFMLFTTTFKVAGLGLAYAASYTIICLITWRMVGKDVPQLQSPSIKKMIIRVLIATGISVGSAALVHYFIFENFIATNSGDALLRLLLDLVITLGMFYALSRIFHIREIKQVLGLIRKPESN